ncbi:MAG: sigma factor-like helix-turn-helix DNA-binding protein [Clostridia bacterium]
MSKPIETETEHRLEQSVEIGTLCAYYGGLLTQKQREALRLHYEEDLSLGEIAEQFEVSRQNIHELITRSAQKLRRYEELLGGVERTNDLRRSLAQIGELLKSVQSSALPIEASQAVQAALALVAQTIRQQEEGENDHGL